MAIWLRRRFSSGNRNFEGRVNPLVKANYLASPPLVVAYALAGTTDIDLTKEPLGKGRDGNDVLSERYLAHPANKSPKLSADSVMPAMFQSRYGSVWDSNPKWNAHQNQRRRSVRVASGKHVHSRAAVFDRSAAAAGADLSQSTKLAA